MKTPTEKLDEIQALHGKVRRGLRSNPGPYLAAALVVPELIAMVRERDAQIEGLKDLVPHDADCDTVTSPGWLPCDCTRDQKIASELKEHP